MQPEIYWKLQKSHTVGHVRFTTELQCMYWFHGGLDLQTKFTIGKKVNVVCRSGKVKGFLFNAGGQTGKDCPFTWADGVKVADRSDWTRNRSLRKGCTNHCTTGPHTGSAEIKLTVTKIPNDLVACVTGNALASRHDVQSSTVWVEARPLCVDCNMGTQHSLQNVGTFLILFSHHTSSQCCKARRFDRVAPAIFK